MPLICRASPLPRIWVVALAVEWRGKNSQVGQIPLLKYASFLHLPAIFQGGGEKRRRAKPISDARAFSEEKRRGAEAYFPA